jgi:hypothetical protein
MPGSDKPARHNPIFIEKFGAHLAQSNGHGFVTLRQLSNSRAMTRSYTKLRGVTSCRVPNSALAT